MVKNLLEIYLRVIKKGWNRSAIGDPEVIILDEPFANLDPTTQIRLKK